MVKPEVRIIEPQQEESVDVNVSQSERDYLLAKYGYKSNDSVESDIVNYNPDANLSFEEMIMKEEQKFKEKIQRERQKNNLPNPYSFERDRINYYENKYSDLDIQGSNYGISVQIVSDMPINNQRR